MSQHKNSNKKCEKWCYVYRKIGITQRINIEATKLRSQIRVMEVKKLHMEKRYKGSNTLALESGTRCKFLQIYNAFFTICGESNTLVSF